MKRVILVSIGLVAAACGSRSRAAETNAAPPVAVDDGRDAAAVALLDAALAAKGELTSLRLVMSGTFASEGTKLDVVVARTIQLPDQLRFDLSFEFPGMGTSTTSYAMSGGRAWESSPGAPFEELSADDRLGVATQLWRDPDLILGRHQEQGTTATSLADEKVGDADCAVISLVAPNGLDLTTVYVDRATHLLAQMTYPEGTGVVVERFDDYRLVNGVQIAHRRTAVSGADAADLTIDEVEVGLTIDPSTFAPPGG